MPELDKALSISLLITITPPTQIITIVISTDYKVMDDLIFTQEPVAQKKYHLLNVTADHGTLMARKDGVTYKYTLLDVHFHILAEHTFGGKSYETEMHMVHIKDREYLAANNITEKAEDKVNDYLVVGTVFTVDGTTDNADVARMNIGTGLKVNDLNLKVYAKPEMSYYHYIGGLTTPDCNQVVNWVVNTNILKISAKQSQTIRKWITGLYPNGNTRVVQALNNRTIYRIDASIVELTTNAAFLKGNMMMLFSVMIAALFL